MERNWNMERIDSHNARAYVWAEIGYFSYWALMGETAPPAEEGVPVIWIIVLVIGVIVALLILLNFRLRRR